MNNIKFILIALIMTVIFVIGIKCGEHHVIKHQKIEKTSIGYEVDFDGEIYEYTED